MDGCDGKEEVMGGTAPLKELRRGNASPHLDSVRSGEKSEVKTKRRRELWMSGWQTEMCRGNEDKDIESKVL